MSISSAAWELLILLTAEAWLGLANYSVSLNTLKSAGLERYVGWLPQEAV